MGKTKFIILFLAFLGPSLQSFGQEDSLNCIDNGAGYQVEYKFRDRNKAWYINALGGYNHAEHLGNFKYGLGFSFEYRLKTLHTLGAGFNLFLAPKSHKVFDGRNDIVPELYFNYRYYYNLKKRMSKGLTGNNFNADYFLLSPSLSFGYEPYTITGVPQWDFNNGGWITKYSSTFKIEPSLRIGYGIQRLLIKSLSFDLNGGIDIRYRYNIDHPFNLLYIQLKIGYIIK